MRGWVLLVIGWAAPLQAQPAPSADAFLARHDRLTRAPDCRRVGVGEIIVCARPDDDRHRLPLYHGEARVEASAPPTLDSHMALAAAAPGSQDECGIFANQRRCSKADMVASGWGGGRDPVTAVGRIVTGIVDPDGVADVPDALPR